jgi:hypothetical protein
MSRKRKTALPAPAPPRHVAVLVLAIFAATFVALEINSYTRKSATWDEPIHLTSGYAALAKHDYRVDPTHPPLLRLWAALPLLFIDGIRMDTGPIDRASMPGWFHDAYEYARRFLYVDNDGDRLLYAARFMSVVWGVILGVLLFCWANEWLGLLPAAAAIAFYLGEPNIAAHASLVTTDIGVTCLVFGTVYFLWRTSRRSTALNVAGLAGCFALAIVAKFSAIVLVPIVGALLLLSAAQGTTITLRRAAVIGGLLIATTLIVVWAVYGFRYAGSDSSGWLFPPDANAGARHPDLVGAAGWIGRHHLLPNAFTEGFVYAQVSAQALPAFLMGDSRFGGWWYYFPFAFLIKTSIALLSMFAIGIVVLLKQRRIPNGGTLAFILVPMAVYLAVAMMSGINIGLRHILPIYPFVLLIGAAAAKELIHRRLVGRGILAALILLSTAEFASVYPFPLTFFNQLVGGPQNGFRYLSDSNLAWGQNLKALKQWMDRSGVTHINLAYFGQADPDYYGIDCTYLPGGPSFAVPRVARPKLPGYVAISSTVLSGVYLHPQWRLFYAPFRDLRPVEVIGNSIRVYWADEWPHGSGPDDADAEVNIHRGLGDFLMGLQWPSEALVHYSRHLQSRPDDVDAILNSGIALTMMNRIPEAIDAFRRAVDAGPEHGEARLTLAKALFGGGDLAGAAEHAERAVVLRPGDPIAIDLLGRVRAVQGLDGEALALFERAVEIDPMYEDAIDHLRYMRAQTVSRARHR